MDSNGLDSGETNPGGRAASPLPRQELALHLKALRKVLLISVCAVFISFLIVFLGFSRQLMAFLEAPMKARGIDLVFISLYETVFIQMKTSFMAGAVIASPLILWQVWAFLKPALYPREGRFVTCMFFVTLALFLAGAVFAYTIVFNLALTFFLVNSEGIASPFISVEKYVDFLTGFILPFGLVFELPVVMALLVRGGLVQVGTFTRLRKYVIFAIFIAAAVLTPPDMVSQVLLALPLIVLFEAGIIVSKIARKK
jgi:sec-independent protein translocase protein TatC